MMSEAARAGLATDHDVIHTGDTQVGTGEEGELGTRTRQAIDELAQTWLEVLTNSTAKILQV